MTGFGGWAPAPTHSRSVKIMVQSVLVCIFWADVFSSSYKPNDIWRDILESVLDFNRRSILKDCRTMWLISSFRINRMAIRNKPETKMFFYTHLDIIYSTHRLQNEKVDHCYFNINWINLRWRWLSIFLNKSGFLRFFP